MSEVLAPPLRALVPHFVNELRVVNELTNTKARFANAVLVNKQNGIFVTNAHAVYAYGTCRDITHYVQLGDRLLQLEFSKHWINWSADLAFLRLNDRRFLTTIDAPRRNIGINLGWEFGKELFITGYCKGIPFFHEVFVSRWRTNYGVNFSGIGKMQEIQSKWRVSNEEMRYLYKKYIEITAYGGVLMRGMSGSAIIDEHRNLVGILSTITTCGTSGLVIPAEEVTLTYLR